MTTTQERRLEDTVLGSAAGRFYRHQNFGTGLLGGVGLGFLLWLLGEYTVNNNPNYGTDMVVTLTMLGWVIGFNLGVGTFNAVLHWILGHDQTKEDELYAAGVGQGKSRYWKYCTDHKVVGTQYLILVFVLFFIGGTLAMMIRTQLLTPNSSFLSPQTYNAIVSIHGMTMIIATIIMVSGPFANFIMPIMIGAKDMAFPRLNAMSIWVIVSAVPPLMATFFVGGVNAGWTTYAPLSVQDGPAMVCFAFTIITFVVSVTVAGINTLITVLTMRAPGMTFSRMPVFVWASVIGGALGLYAMPAFLLDMTMMVSDHATGTSFFVSAQGGSGWLWENVFWIMGHPEVYVILIPPVGALMEVLSTFSRKPVFAYKMIIGAMIGIAGLSIMVWAHHMFTTGWAPDLAGPFMLTTELISIPTGIVFLCAIGTMWRGSNWVRLPMYFGFLFIWNFIVGGVTGIYLSDVPADDYFHGNMFVTAHFHYTLLGGAMIAATAGLCYWFPKVTGRMLDEKTGRAAFWLIAIGFQVTYLAQFYEGFKGMPRRVANYDPIFAPENVVSSIGAYVLMAGWIVLLYALVSSWRSGSIAPANPWSAKSLEWQTLTPVPLENFLEDVTVVNDAYGYGERAELQVHAVFGSTSDAHHGEGH